MAGRNITSADLEIARTIYPILVQCAARRETITYGELIDRGRRAAPDSAAMASAIPVGFGRRLDVLRTFTDAEGRPDLASLVVNERTGEVGAAFSAAFDAAKIGDAVFSFDWRVAAPDFDAFETATEEHILKRPKIKRDAAKAAMSAYYAANRTKLAPDISAHRERYHRTEEAFIEAAGEPTRAQLDPHP
jgi:hypothetical protein